MGAFMTRTAPVRARNGLLPTGHSYYWSQSRA